MRRSIGLLVAAGLCASSQTTTPRPEFEVVSIKPSAPGQIVEMGNGIARKTMGPRPINDPSRYTRPNATLLLLIMQAYSLKTYQVAGPDWMKTERFDITAKKPEGATSDQLLAMIQSMLESRFQLKFHHEQREMPVLELSVGKNGPKLTESPAVPPVQPQPASNKMAIDADGFPILNPGGSGGASINGRMTERYTERTMAMFADMLAGRFTKPVIDRTGLSAKYDITLRYVIDSMPSPAGAAAPNVDAPIGPTLMEAIQSQLGLKLDPKKGMIDVLVIDHAEKVPIEN